MSPDAHDVLMHEPQCTTFTLLVHPFHGHRYPWRCQCHQDLLSQHPKQAPPCCGVLLGVSGVPQNLPEGYTPQETRIVAEPTVRARMAVPQILIH